MLHTYLKYKDTLYKAVGTDAVVMYEERKTIKKTQHHQVSVPFIRGRYTMV